MPLCNDLTTLTLETCMPGGTGTEVMGAGLGGLSYKASSLLNPVGCISQHRHRNQSCVLLKKEGELSATVFGSLRLLRAAYSALCGVFCLT